VERKRQHWDGRGCLSDEREREERVTRPPKMRKISAGPSDSEGKSDLSEKPGQFP